MASNREYLHPSQDAKFDFLLRRPSAIKETQFEVGTSECDRISHQPFSMPEQAVIPLSPSHSLPSSLSLIYRRVYWL